MKLLGIFKQKDGRVGGWGECLSADASTPTDTDAKVLPQTLLPLDLDSTYIRMSGMHTAYVSVCRLRSPMEMNGHPQSVPNTHRHPLPLQTSGQDCDLGVGVGELRPRVTIPSPPSYPHPYLSGLHMPTGVRRRGGKGVHAPLGHFSVEMRWWHVVRETLGQATWGQMTQELS